LPPILPATQIGRNLFSYDKSDDGGPKPCFKLMKPEALRFASIASHNLPCRERFAKRFSEGVFEIPKTLFLYALTAFPVSAARNAEQGHTYRAIQGYSRNCLNISMWRGKRQPSGCGSVTKHAPGGETGGTVVTFGRGNTFFTTEAQRFGSKDAPVGPGPHPPSGAISSARPWRAKARPARPLRLRLRQTMGVRAYGVDGWIGVRIRARVQGPENRGSV
jgi:hypothetical protein